MRPPDHIVPLTAEQVRSILTGPRPSNQVYPMRGIVKETVELDGVAYFVDLDATNRVAHIWRSSYPARPDDSRGPESLSVGDRRAIVALAIARERAYRENDPREVG